MSNFQEKHCRIVLNNDKINAIDGKSLYRAVKYGCKMRRAKVFVNGILAGELQEVERGINYRFVYLQGYSGSSVSLEMPTTQPVYEFDRFPPFFEGVLPEGVMLEGLLHHAKLDRNDMMSQLIAIGQDLVGNVTVEAID